jgi:biopolymer transport protein ExbD
MRRRRNSPFRLEGDNESKLNLSSLMDVLLVLVVFVVLGFSYNQFTAVDVNEYEWFAGCIVGDSLLIRIDENNQIFMGGNRRSLLELEGAIKAYRNRGITYGAMVIANEDAKVDTYIKVVSLLKQYKIESVRYTATN